MRLSGGRIHQFHWQPMALAKNRNFTVGLFAVLGLSFGLSTNAIAQVVGSSGSRNLSTQVGGTSSEAVITGGTQKGNKLFHSFSRFDIAPGSSAVFDGNGSSGVQTIFGRIETGPSKLAGPLGGRNWGGASPELMLMNPFGFIVEKGFSSSGLTPLSLFAVDALMFRDPSSQALFQFDMNISATGLQLTTPNWNTAEFVGFLMDSSYPNGQGGASISVQGGFGLPHLNLAGSKINIEGDPLKVDKLNINAQAFNGAFIKDLLDLPGSFQVGSFNPNDGVFIPYTSASQVGGVAPETGFVRSTRNLREVFANHIYVTDDPTVEYYYKTYGFNTGAAMGAEYIETLWCTSCPETTIQITANIEPYQSSTTSLNLVGRQIVLGLWPERNNITSGTVVEFTSYLGGGLYSASVLLPKTVTPSTDADVKRDDYVDFFLGWLASLNDSEKAAMRDLNPGAYFKEVLGPEGSIKGFAPVAAPATAQSQAASIPAAPAAVLAPTTPDRIASAQVIASLEQSEQRNSEKVAVALGLSLQEAAKSLSTVDIQNGLKTAITSVRTAAGKQAGLGLDPGLGLLASAATNNQALLNPAFNRAAYNPAVLHLRYSNASVGGFDAQLDLVLITATGEPKGIRVPLRQADFRDSLQKLYGALSRQENLAVNDPNGPSHPNAVSTTIDESAFIVVPSSVIIYESPILRLSTNVVTSGEIETMVYGYLATKVLVAGGVRRFNLT